MKPVTSGRRISSCMEIQAPNDTPTSQQMRVSRLKDCSQSSAEAASDSSPAVLEQTLAPSHPAEIEPQHREAAFGEHIVERMNDGIVHGPAKLRVGMRNSAIGAPGSLAFVYRPSIRPAGPLKITSGMSR